MFKPLKEKLGACMTITLGASLQLTGYMMMPNSNAAWLFLVAFGLQSTGGRLLAPFNSAALSTLCPSHLRGRAMGINSAFGAAARIFAAFVLAPIYDSFGHVLPFYICGLSGMVASVLLMYLHLDIQKDKDAAADQIAVA